MIKVPNKNFIIIVSVTLVCIFILVKMHALFSYTLVTMKIFVWRQMSYAFFCVARLMGHAFLYYVGGNEMKKALSVLLCLCLVMSVFTALPLAASATTFDETHQSVGASSGTTGSCTWSLDDNSVLTISGCGAMDDYSYDSTLPWGKNIISVIINDGVTNIGNSAFYGSTGLTSVTIPDSVTRIGNATFSGCTGLTSVTIPNNVISIGTSAFYGCTGLTSVTIPDKATSIGNFAFAKCTGLTGVTIGNSVKSIGNYAFCDCTGLTSITIPSSVTSIGEWALKNCTGLTSVTFGDSVTIIAYSALKDTAWFNNQPDGLVYAGKVAYSYKGTMPPNTSIVIQDGTKGIGNQVFRDCTGLTSVTIPDSVTSIGNCAFENCSGLTSVTIGNGVTSIGNEAFSGCAGLKSVTIPDSVTSIGEYAFSNCAELKSVNISDIAAWCRIDFRKANYRYQRIESNPLYYAHNLYLNNELVTDLVIPDSVTNIGNSAFYNCTGLTSVAIPDSVTSIGELAFYGCTGLSGITIPDSMTSIGCNAFYNTAWYNNQPDGLVYAGKFAYKYKGIIPQYSSRDIDIKDGTKGIVDYAFYNCAGVTSITIPDSVTSIGDYAFRCNGLESVIIPDSVTSIGNYAFYNCNELTNVTIGNGVTSIGDYAFAACKIRSVTIGNSVTRIGNYAFSGGNIMKSVTIPDSVTSIGCSVFYGCWELISITIPDSVTSIGQNAFHRTAWYDNQPNGLVYAGKVAYKYKETNNTSVVIKDGTKGIAGSAFDGCTRLTNVTIPDSVTSIGNYAFENTAWYNSQPDGLVYAGKVAYRYKGTMPDNTSIVIRDGTKGIADYAFSDYNGHDRTGLICISIPDSVTSIGDCAFSGCERLTSITIPDNVTSIGDKAFGYYIHMNYEEYIKISDFTILGKYNSEAQRYANENGFIFKELIDFMLGDADGDGIINIRDVTAIQRHLAELEPFNEEQLAFTDTNGDGVVDIADATHLQMYLAEYDVVLGKQPTA